MKLGLRDRIIITIFGFLAVFYCAYNFAFVPTGERIAKLREEKSQVQGLSADITPIMEQAEKLQSKEKELSESVRNIKTLDGGATAVNEEFLVFLGERAEVNNVSVIGYNDLGADETNGVYTSEYDFELRGRTQDINKVLEDIDGIGIKCSYGSVSLRQNEDMDYLKRFFDDLTDLPWYSEPEEEKKAVEVVPKKESEEKPVQPVYPVQPAIPSIVLPKEEPVKEPAEETVPDVPKEAATPVVPDEKDVQTETANETEEHEENINDRLDKLLEQTASNGNYNIILIAGQESGIVQYKQSQTMRLAVTVKLIMFREPSEDTSFLKRRGANSVEVL